MPKKINFSIKFRFICSFNYFCHYGLAKILVLRRSTTVKCAESRWHFSNGINKYTANRMASRHALNANRQKYTILIIYKYIYKFFLALT